MIPLSMERDIMHHSFPLTWHYLTSADWSTLFLFYCFFQKPLMADGFIFTQQWLQSLLTKPLLCYLFGDIAIKMRIFIKIIQHESNNWCVCAPDQFCGVWPDLHAVMQGRVRRRLSPASSAHPICHGAHYFVGGGSVQQRHLANISLLRQ